MKLQYLCHPPVLCMLIGFATSAAAAEPSQPVPTHDYPTIARVEYVNQCVDRHGGQLAAVYQCACAINRIANVLSYDDYVAASTSVQYATLGGERGGIFRTDDAKKLAKTLLDIEADALRSCGMSHVSK
jgi:hypothetical protein